MSEHADRIVQTRAKPGLLARVLEIEMLRRGALPLFVAAVLSAALFASATAASSGRSVRPVRLAGPFESKGRVIADGRSHLLLVRGAFQEYSGITTRINLNGSVARSFGDEGTVNTGGQDAVVEPSGKILLATTSHPGGGIGVDTRARVTRLLPDGKRDPSFGVEGSTDIDFGNHYDYGETIALAANGDILLGGIRVDLASNYESEYSLAVARLRPSGSLDRSFGRMGVSILPASGEIVPFDIAATPSGGAVLEGGNNVETFFCKVTADGSFDRHFGQAGFLELKGLRGKSAHHEGLSTARGFAVLPSGKLLVAATGSPAFNRHRVVAFRLWPDGRVDHSYGHDGLALAKSHAETFARGTTLLPGGTFAIATNFTRGDSREAGDFGAIAFNPDGHIERSFGRHESCRAGLAGPQEATEAIDVGGRAVVLGDDDESPRRWLLDCSPVGRR
jgi:uncharacterized delta-60 repeat protein